jgi:hypothetical protein
MPSLKSVAVTAAIVLAVMYASKKIAIVGKLAGN